MYAHHMLQVVGKPEAAFFQLALSDLGVPPSAAVMVGDDVRDDVGGALACGMAGILGEGMLGTPNQEALPPTRRLLQQMKAAALKHAERGHMHADT
jgi:FMN phosphatase YigB (HAD superfamily)